MTPSATSAVHCGSGFDARFEPISASPFEPIQCWPLSLGEDMRRREFISLLGGGAATWPLAARAQQKAKVARYRLPFPYASPHEKHFNAFRDGLRALGYVEGQNIVIEQRYAAGAFERLQMGSQPTWCA